MVGAIIAFILGFACYWALSPMWENKEREEKRNTRNEPGLGKIAHVSDLLHGELYRREENDQAQKIQKFEAVETARDHLDA